MSQITVLIADDHAVAREGLRAMLASDPTLRIVDEAADGQEAVDRAAALHPDVVLMDLKMPGLDGIEATRQLKAQTPDTAVIVITYYDDDALLIDAVRAGASGFLLKDASRDLIRHTIGAVANGGMLIKTALLRRALGDRDVPDRREIEKPIERLSTRERQVLTLLAEGRTNRLIGAHLGLAEVTVKKHVHTIAGKLGACDRTDAAVRALRLGLIH